MSVPPSKEDSSSPGSAPDIANLPMLQGLVKWTAVHGFGVTTELVITGSGSGDGNPRNSSGRLRTD